MCSYTSLCVNCATECSCCSFKITKGMRSFLYDVPFRLPFRRNNTSNYVQKVFFFEFPTHATVLVSSIFIWTLDVNPDEYVRKICEYFKRSVDVKNQLDFTFVFFISLLIVTQHVRATMCPSSGADDCVML